MGWRAPDLDGLPNGGELVERYLRPLAAVPEIAGNLRLGATVTGITREGMDKVRSQDRANAPFIVRYIDRKGEEHRIKARSVIDASGTWTQPNPMGVDGLCVPGEKRCSDRIAYGIPDVVRAERQRYAGKRTLVIGGGHSADQRRAGADGAAAGRTQDRNPLGAAAQVDRQAAGRWAERPAARTRRARPGGKAGYAGRPPEDADPFRGRMRRAEAGWRAGQSTLDGEPVSLEVDRIVVTTGFRPDLSFLRELRIELDPAVEAPPRLAPLIDPNFHSCGTVPPHGIEELSHPEKASSSPARNPMAARRPS